MLEGESLRTWLAVLERAASLGRHPARTLPLLIESLADRFGATPALLGEDQTLSYRELADRANQYARWALDQGLGAGDTVCLLMPNCPEYLAVWLGITRVGGIVALLNTNLVGTSLAHAIRAVSPQHILVAAELAPMVASVLPDLASVRCWSHGENEPGLRRIEDAIEGIPADRLSEAECVPPSPTDCALYIYTSGTTGLPKAARVSHARLMQWSQWFGAMLDPGPADRMYNCLPMYHSIGGVVAIGAMLVHGRSVVIRRRFSVARFWDDVIASECTLFQYIGELCRYLLHAPPHPLEREHQLRLCCGNGLRPDVWTGFQRRFGIPHIIEFFAATEGNVSLYNLEERPGAIGRIPKFLAPRSPVALVRHDVETGEPVRDAQGFCVRAGPNEVGEAIGRIDGSSPASGFEGYTDPEASRRKVLRNAFETGDAWFRTGDLMRKDAAGFFYFVDRIGDTFRWKGENVATTEVADIIGGFPGVSEVVVYGVAVPGTEGRAGMAALVVGEDFELTAFREFLVEQLPGYARPLFLRLCERLDATGTFKSIKQELARQGFDPSATVDAIWFDDRERFARLDPALYRQIQAGDVSL